MSAKQFFYTAAGILLLVIAYSVGARNAVASLDMGSHVVGAWTTTVLSADGTYWDAHANEAARTVQWQPHSGSANFPEQQTSPVPVQDIAFWTPNCVITRDNYAWVYMPTNPSVVPWVRSDAPLPTPAVSSANTTWSGIKQGYRK